MRERQKLQERALDGFDKASARLEREEQRRVDTIKKLDDQVATAKADQLLALAVLAEMVGDEDETAALAYVEPADVKAARKAHPAASVRDAVERLGGRRRNPSDDGS
jgi:hypothetical protein